MVLWYLDTNMKEFFAGIKERLYTLFSFLFYNWATYTNIKKCKLLLYTSIFPFN